MDARMDAPEQRLAQNEALFREVNERVRAVAHKLGPSLPYEFLCECARVDCTARLALSIHEYEAIREDSTQFFVSPLHYSSEIDEVVVRGDVYWVVRKIGEAADYAKSMDPRRR